MMLYKKTHQNTCVLARLKLNIQIKMSFVAAHFFLCDGHQTERDDDQDDGNDGTLDKAYANGQPRAGTRPEPGGSSQSADMSALSDNDRTCAQETDTADDLCAKSGDITVRTRKM